jgi:hypothetical protein
VSSSSIKSDLSLPYIEDFVQYPDVSPQSLVEYIEEYSHDESVFDYLDDLISVAEGMLAYAGAVRPVLERIAEAVRSEEEADA